jgi:cytochrome P450
VTSDALVLDPSAAAFLADPHAAFDALRPLAPLVRDPLGWSTIDHATSTAAFGSTQLIPGIDPLLQSRGIEPLWGERGRTLTDSEGADHQRLRRAVAPWFTARRVEQLRARVAALADQLVAAAAPGEPFDVMAGLADVVPSRLFCWMVGLPDADAAPLAALSKTLLTVFTATDAMVAPVRAAKGEMAEVTRSLITRRLAEPGDDLTSALLAAQRAGDLDEVDVFHLVEELLSASVDNTANTLGLMIWTLARHPEAAADLAARGVTAAAVEELMRFEPAIRHTIKVAVAPVRLGDIDVEPGEFVTVRIAAANRDPAAFPDPHRIDLDRVQPRSQLAFGMGRHFCLGAALARIELVEMLRAVLARWPQFTVGDGARLDVAGAGIVSRLPIAPMVADSMEG